MINLLPELNAILNGISALFLLAGLYGIKRRRVHFHRFCMVCAFTVSILFLVSYLYYHGHAGVKEFTGQGFAICTIYFTILFSHSLLAAAVPILAVITLGFALRRRFKGHTKIARWTYPIWIYVSVTGVVIYLMLYR